MEVILVRKANEAYFCRTPCIPLQPLATGRKPETSQRSSPKGEKQDDASGRSRAVDYVSTVLTDTSLLSIISAFYHSGLLRILTLKATWLHDHAVLVERHRSAASLQLIGFEGDWSELVQAAKPEMDIRTTWESSTQVGLRTRLA